MKGTNSGRGSSKTASKKRITKKSAKLPPKDRRRIVITAGPTREYIDPVRFLSNESSGRMGFALAQRAAELGHQVTLIAGPVCLETPKGVTRVDILSARDLLSATKKAFRDSDALFMAAAVADFRPARKLSGKWRKKDDGSEEASIALVKNPDVLATVARTKGTRMVIGFALETGNGLRRARAKLVRKNLDYIALNDASALNATHSSVTILGADGSELEIVNKPKGRIAETLLRLLSD